MRSQFAYLRALGYGGLCGVGSPIVATIAWIQTLAPLNFDRIRGPCHWLRGPYGSKKFKGTRVWIHDHNRPTAFCPPYTASKP